MKTIAKPGPSLDDLQAWLESDAAPAEFYELHGRCCTCCPVARFLQWWYGDAAVRADSVSIWRGSQCDEIRTGFAWQEVADEFDAAMTDAADRRLTRAEALAALVAHRRAA